MARHAQALLVLLAASVAQVQGIHLSEDPNVFDQNYTSISKWITDDPRVFFFAGLEGSGQKIFQQLWFDSFTDGTAEGASDANHHVIHFPKSWSCGKQWNLEGKQDMVARFKKLKTNDIWSMPYTAAYPSCGIRNPKEGRTFNFHPNVEWIKDAAQGTSIALHVVLLYRDLKETLALDCLQRTNADCRNQAKTLIENAKTLKAQVDDLANRDVSCFRYFDDVAMEKEILERFQIANQTNIREVFRERRLGNKVKELPKADIKMLEHQNSLMDRLCTTMDPFNLGDFNTVLRRARKETLPCDKLKSQAKSTSP